MSRLLSSLSSLVGAPGRSSKRAASDPGPSTLSTPLFPLSGSDDAPHEPHEPHLPPQTHQPPAAEAAASNAASAGTGARSLVPLSAPAAPHRRGPSRALKAAVRASTQVVLPTAVEPTAPRQAARQRPGVVLTETEKLRLQVMQVQLRLTDLGLYNGTIDGMMNPALVEGVRHFQVLKGLRDSGTLTAATLMALAVRALD